MRDALAKAFEEALLKEFKKPETPQCSPGGLNVVKEEVHSADIDSDEPRTTATCHLCKEEFSVPVRVMEKVKKTQEALGALGGGGESLMSAICCDPCSRKHLGKEQKDRLPGPGSLMEQVEEKLALALPCCFTERTLSPEERFDRGQEFIDAVAVSVEEAGSGFDDMDSPERLRAMIQAFLEGAAKFMDNPPESWLK